MTYNSLASKEAQSPLRLPGLLTEEELARAIKDFTIGSATFEKRDGSSVTLATGDTFTRRSYIGDTTWEVLGLGRELGAPDLGVGTDWLVLARCREDGIQGQYVNGNLVTVAVEQGDHLLYMADSVAALVLADDKTPLR